MRQQQQTDRQTDRLLRNKRETTTHLILIVGLGDRGSVVVGMQALVGLAMYKANLCTVLEVVEGSIPVLLCLVGARHGQRHAVLVRRRRRVVGSGRLDDDPLVVLVDVRVEGDLLLA